MTDPSGTRPRGWGRTAVAIAHVGLWLMCNVAVGVVGALLTFTAGDTLRPWLFYGKLTTNEVEGMGGDAVPFVWSMLVLGVGLTVLLAVFVNVRIAREISLPKAPAVVSGVVVSLGVPLLLHFDAGWVLGQWFGG